MADRAARAARRRRGLRRPPSGRSCSRRGGASWRDSRPRTRQSSYSRTCTGQSILARVPRVHGRVVAGGSAAGRVRRGAGCTNAAPDGEPVGATPRRWATSRRCRRKRRPSSSRTSREPPSSDPRSAGRSSTAPRAIRCTRRSSSAWSPTAGWNMRTDRWSPRCRTACTPTSRPDSTRSRRTEALLQDAAVVGKVFWVGALHEIEGRDPEDTGWRCRACSEELVRPVRTGSMEDERVLVLARAGTRRRACAPRSPVRAGPPSPGGRGLDRAQGR